MSLWNLLFSGERELETRNGDSDFFFVEGFLVKDFFEILSRELEEEEESLRGVPALLDVLFLLLLGLVFGEESEELELDEDELEDDLPLLIFFLFILNLDFD